VSDTLIAAARQLAAAADEHELRGDVESADAVIAARLALQAAFVQAGWIAPPYQQDEMSRDQLILRQRNGVIEEMQDDIARR
jgi:hypothetical protein